MLIALCFFSFSVVVLLYIYLGYPILVTLCAMLKGSKSKNSNNKESYSTPTVSLIIPARNEEKAIKDKIENSLAVDYPREKLEIIIVSDGSTDRTNNIVYDYIDKGVKLVDLPVHSGQSAAQNAGIKEATGEIIVFSDATGMFLPNAVRNIIQRFTSPEIGCVTGKVVTRSTSARSGAGTDIYRTYELFIRSKESSLGNLAVATGAIHAIRRDLFSPLNILFAADFMLPLKAIRDGYKVVQESSAICIEDANPLSGVFKRRRQIISKDFYGLMSMKEMLNPFKFPLVAWGLFSHKFLRWLGTIFLLMCIISSALLAKSVFFLFLLILQVLFYACAATGWLLKEKYNTPRILQVPCNFCISNLAALIGIIYYLLGKQTGKWDPVRS